MELCKSYKLTARNLNCCLISEVTLHLHSRVSANDVENGDVCAEDGDAGVEDDDDVGGDEVGGDFQ